MYGGSGVVWRVYGVDELNYIMRMAHCLILGSELREDIRDRLMC